MFVSFRTAVLVLASLASASVAPAQVVPGTFAAANSSPSVEVASNELPRSVAPSPIETPVPPFAGEAVESETTVAPKGVSNESLGAMVSRLGSDAPASRERICLATAIYFEAKSEPLAGQLAVGEVLANRIKSGRFASSFCGVVTQRGQFSFIRGGALPRVPRASLQWKNAVAVATIVEARLMRSAAPAALFFHARRVSPSWHATRVATIGNHVFYR